MIKVVDKDRLMLMLKALIAVECLVSDVAAGDWQMEGRDDLCARKIRAIYRLIHSVTADTCYDVHEDWRAELQKAYGQFADGNFVAKDQAEQLLSILKGGRG